MQTVTIKVPERVVEVVEEMVRLGIARSRNHAYNVIIDMGLPKALELVKRKRRVEELTQSFLRDGLPYRDLPTVEDVEEARSR
ncbi:MAG: VapB-type antitoxin [Thermoprotei archaeon]|nr:MAG: VapB-type antitoxin [Thermoprotei archaeon]RLF21380.1 MAG: VapB-type antitoxin [Thermoprotei archaeon]